jgi:hypothetical protein
MDINHYSFSSKQINPSILELCVTHLESKTSFGLRINAQGNPSKEQIFDIFKQHYKNFWVEVEDITKKDLTKDGSDIIVEKDEKSAQTI